MPEPIKLLDHLAFAGQCPKCGHVFHLPVPVALKTHGMDCLKCGVVINLGVGGELYDALERGFQKLQAKVREAGCWVEVRPSPQ